MDGVLELRVDGVLSLVGLFVDRYCFRDGCPEPAHALTDGFSRLALVVAEVVESLGEGGLLQESVGHLGCDGVHGLVHELNEVVDLFLVSQGLEKGLHEVLVAQLVEVRVRHELVPSRLEAGLRWCS